MAGDDTDTVAIASGRMSARVAMQGAELVRLQDEAGRDLLWDGDPAYWTGRSPILFPIVGRLTGDGLNVGGTRHPMRQHGLARVSRFDLAGSGDAWASFRLAADDATRRAYPFDFELVVSYRLDGATLSIEGTVHNRGPSAMPASFGFHPAFRWPLPYGAAAMDHRITFAQDEPEPLASVEGGLLSPARRPTPVEGRVLALTPHLFDADALIFLAPASRSLRFGPPGGRGLRIDFPGMPQLGLWSKPGAPFLCIEPWSGYASPAGFDGDLADKPGMTSVAPGGSRSFAMGVSLDAP